MKFVLLLSLISFTFVSCTHTHSMKSHHEQVSQHMFNKKCALAVAEGKFHVKGSDKYVLEDKGHYYYFSSRKALDKFKEKQEHNIEKANKNWFAGNR